MHRVHKKRSAEIRDSLLPIGTRAIFVYKDNMAKIKWTTNNAVSGFHTAIPAVPHEVSALSMEALHSTRCPEVMRNMFRTARRSLLVVHLNGLHGWRSILVHHPRRWLFVVAAWVVRAGRWPLRCRRVVIVGDHL